MVTTSTARLQLLKPTPGTGEPVLVQADLNDNWDKIDNAAVGPGKLPTVAVKRNTLDAVNSASQLVLETLTAVLKASHWYEINSYFRANSSVAIGSSPNGTVEIKYKAGGTVANSDPPLARSNIHNCNTASPSTRISMVFDVPTDGTYTFGVCVDSGTTGNTVNILASGGAGNLGFDRCFWVKDLGEK